MLASTIRRSVGIARDEPLLWYLDNTRRWSPSACFRLRCDAPGVIDQRPYQLCLFEQQDGFPCGVRVGAEVPAAGVCLLRMLVVVLVACTAQHEDVCWCPRTAAGAGYTVSGVQLSWLCALLTHSLSA